MAATTTATLAPAPVPAAIEPSGTAPAPAPLPPPRSASAIGVAVREARPEEYPLLEDAIVEAYRASMEVSAEYEADMRRLAQHAASYRVWVAVDETDEVLGTVLTPRADVPYTGHGEPEGERAFRLLTVAPSARGRGVGRLLIDHAIAEIAATGARRVSIWTGAQMPAAVRLYESYGFTRHPERETFTVDGGKVPLSYTYDVPDALFAAPRSSPATAHPVPY